MPIPSVIKQKPWVIIGVIVIIIAGIFGYQKLHQTTTAPQYQTATVAKGTLVAAVAASGTVASTNNAVVTTQATGVVSKVLVKDGQHVKAGTPLVKIDLDLSGKQKAQQALASYQSAKNSLSATQANLYSLQSKLFAANQKFMNGAVVQGLATTDPNYIQQNADWLASEASYKDQNAVITQAQTAVSQAWYSYQQTSDTIYAPIAGVVSGLSLQPGNVISSSETATKLANITTTAAPMVKANLTEIDVAKIKVGQKVTITFDALTDQTFVGKVVSIDTVGQVSSGVTSYPASIQLEDNNTNILPNMAATANILTDSKSDVLFVPNAAIQKQTGVTTVRVMKNGQPSSVQVETGLVTDTQTEITDGLQEGDVVVTGIVAATTKAATGTSPFSAIGGNRGFGAAGGATLIRTNVAAPTRTGR